MQGQSGIEHAAGLAFLQDCAERRQAAAPFERLLRFRLQQVSAGQVTLLAEPAAECANPMHTLHGGYFAALLDAAMSASVHSLLHAGQAFTTVEMKVSFMRAVPAPFAALRACGKVRKAGRRIAFAEGLVYSEMDELLASGSVTCLIWQAENDRSKAA